jgi:hypothetical protein
MPQKTPIWGRAYRLTLSQPVLWLFGAFSAIGGALNVSGIAIAYGIHALVLQTWFAAEGAAAIQKIIAVSIGLLLSFIIVLAISAYAQAIIIHNSAAKYYQAKDPWYGVLRVALRSIWPITIVTFCFYIFSGLLSFGLAKAGDLVISSIAVNSIWSSTIVPIAITIICVIVITLLGILTVFTINFIVIYRMPLARAFLCAWDLLLEYLFSSYLNLLAVAGTYLFSLAICLAVYAPLVFLAVWIAHFIVPSQVLLQAISSNIQGGLLITILVGILFIVNAILSVFMNIDWTLFFLDHVSAALVPKESSRSDVSEIAESVGST